MKPIRFFFITSLCFIAAISTGYLFGDYALAIVLSLIALTIAFISYLTTINFRSKFEVIDLSLFLVASTYLYVVIPPLTYAMAGFQFGILSDNRLKGLDPTPETFFPVLTYHCIYFLALSFFSLLLKKNVIHPQFSIIKPPPVHTILSVLAILVFVLAIQIALMSSSNMLFLQIVSKLNPIKVLLFLYLIISSSLS